MFTSAIDLEYLGRLSADAVPALTGLPAELRGCVLADIASRLGSAPDDWRGWNAARAEARRVPTEPTGQCRRPPA